MNDYRVEGDRMSKRLEVGKKGRKATQESTSSGVEAALIGGNSDIISKSALNTVGGGVVAGHAPIGKPLPGFPPPGSSKGDGIVVLDVSEDEPKGGQKSIRSAIRAKVVFGSEDRVRLSPADEPFRHICYLEYVTADGSSMRGSGWLVGPSTVITAGHCVWDREHGNNFNRSMKVFPARDGDLAPASANAEDFQTVKAWARDGDTAFDYGAVFLDRPLGNDFGFFSFAQFPDEDLSRMIVNIVGYPATIKRNGQMIAVTPPLLFGQSNRVNEVRAHELVYTIDTTPGNSGGPVICFEGDDKFTVVGIHNEGTSAGNFATRITSEVFDNIKKWKNH
jgi:glutamyl endopeptidase